MNPVQAHFCVGEVLLLECPDVIGAVSQEDRAFLAVSTLVGFIHKPTKQLGMASKRSDEALVDWAFKPGRRPLERVDSGNNC